MVSHIFPIIYPQFNWQLIFKKRANILKIFFCFTSSVNYRQNFAMDRKSAITVVEITQLLLSDTIIYYYVWHCNLHQNRYAADLFLTLILVYVKKILPLLNAENSNFFNYSINSRQKNQFFCDIYTSERIWRAIHYIFVNFNIWNEWVFQVAGFRSCYNVVVVVFCASLIFTLNIWISIECFDNFFLYSFIRKCDSELKWNSNFVWRTQRVSITFVLMYEIYQIFDLFSVLVCGYSLF